VRSETGWVAVVAAGSLLFVSSTGFAEGRSGAQWTDHHMRTNFANHGRVAPRPALQGVDANGRIAVDPVQSAAQVAPLELTINPHGWQPGPGRAGSRMGAHRSSSFSSWSSAVPSRSAGLRKESSPGVRRRSR
jgi:hypothetical protein